MIIIFHALSDWRGILYIVKTHFQLQMHLNVLPVGRGTRVSWELFSMWFIKPYIKAVPANFSGTKGMVLAFQVHGRARMSSLSSFELTGIHQGCWAYVLDKGLAHCNCI